MRNDHPALRRRCTPQRLVGERNAATAMPGNPRPTTTHSPSPQVVKVPSARARVRRSRCGPCTISAMTDRPVVPDARPPRPRYAFCLHAAEQYTNRRPAPGNARGNRAPHCAHSPIPNIVTRHGGARYFRRVRLWASTRAADRRGSPISRSAPPIHITTVLGRKDSDHASVLVDGIQHPVTAPACRPTAPKLTLQGLPDPARLTQEITGDELDHRRRDRLGQAVGDSPRRRPGCFPGCSPAATPSPR